MKHFRKMTLSLLSCVVLFSNLLAQSRVEIRYRPKELQNPHDGIVLEGTFTPSDANPWIAWSDRDNNYTESSPKAGDKKVLLKFMEPVYIQSYSKGYAHIYQGELDQESDDKVFLNKAKDLGYIHMEKLLLWTQAIRTDMNIQRKAVLMNNLKNLGKIADNKVSIDTIRFYSDPEFKHVLPERRTLLEVLYVFDMSPSGDALLLGPEPLMSRSPEENFRILGWTEATRVIQWNTRFAIEPNFDPEAVAERSAKGVHIVFFDNRPAAEKYRDEGVFTPNIRELSFDKRPTASQFFRFPVHRWGTLEHVSVLGDIVTNTSKRFKAEEGLEAVQTLQASRTAAKHINLIFVIDGTKSMEPYFSAVCNTLVEKFPAIDTMLFDTEFSFGAVIYRDMEEGLLKSCEQVPLSKDYIRVGEKIKEINVYYKKDTSAHESVFLGLQTALRMFNNPRESNILIHIGDAGNHPRGTEAITEEEIVKLMVQKECTYIAYQAGLKSKDRAYVDFGKQTESIMLKYAKEIYRSQMTGVLAASGLNKLKEPTAMQGEEGYRYVWEEDPRGLIYLPCQTSGSNDPIMLTGIINQEIMAANQRKDAALEGIDKISQGEDMPGIMAALEKKQQNDQKASNWDYAMSDYPMYFIDKYLKGLTKEQLDFFMAGKRVQTYISGYTSKTSAGLKYPIYKYVIFMPLADLYVLQEKIKRLSDFPADDDLRKAAQDFWRTLYNEITNEKKTDSELANMDTETFNQTVFGLPVPSKTLGNITYRMLGDKNAVKASVFNKYIEAIQKNVQKYIEMEINRADYKYRMGNLVYVWVTDEIIP